MTSERILLLEKMMVRSSSTAKNARQAYARETLSLLTTTQVYLCIFIPIVVSLEIPKYGVDTKCA